MSEAKQRKEKPTRLERKNRNAMRKQVSNWFLATSLALTGTGLLETFTDSPRFSVFEAVLFIVLGFAAILVSVTILRYMEDEDKADD